MGSDQIKLEIAFSDLTIWGGVGGPVNSEKIEKMKYF